MPSWLWDGYHLFHLAANQPYCSCFSLRKFLLDFVFCPAVLDSNFQFLMSLSRLWWNFWCVVALVPPTTQSIFDKIMPSTYSSAPTKITSTSLSFSTSTSTTINPTITRLSSSRATPVASRTYTVAVGKVSIPNTLLQRSTL